MYSTSGSGERFSFEMYRAIFREQPRQQRWRWHVGRDENGMATPGGLAAVVGDVFWGEALGEQIARVLHDGGEAFVVEDFQLAIVEVEFGAEIGFGEGGEEIVEQLRGIGILE